MGKHKSKKHTKRHLPQLEPFLINFFKLKPNRYTQNDYLFIKQGSDYDVAYNPRCQLLDITPVTERFADHVLPYHAERITNEVKKLWEDLAFSFLLEHGVNLDDYMVARLYGLKSDNYPYITYLTKHENEWDEIENWAEIFPKYQKRKLFKYAYFGSVQDQQLRIPAKIRKEQQKEYYKGRSSRKPNIMPEYIANLYRMKFD